MMRQSLSLTTFTGCDITLIPSDGDHFYSHRIFIQTTIEDNPEIGQQSTVNYDNFKS